MLLKGSALLFLAASFCNTRDVCEAHYWYAPFYNTSLYETTCDFFADKRLRDLTKGYAREGEWRVEEGSFCEIALPFLSDVQEEQR